MKVREDLPGPERSPASARPLTVGGAPPEVFPSPLLLLNLREGRKPSAEGLTGAATAWEKALWRCASSPAPASPLEPATPSNTARPTPEPEPAHELASCRKAHAAPLAHLPAAKKKQAPGGAAGAEEFADNDDVDTPGAAASDASDATCRKRHSSPLEQLPAPKKLHGDGSAAEASRCVRCRKGHDEP